MKKLVQKGVPVPLLNKFDESNYIIEMVFTEGIKLKDFINEPSLEEENLKQVLRNIGYLVSKIHEAGVIHGDLTTSNMIMSENKVITILDFGLSYFKESAEDRAVDLYVL